MRLACARRSPCRAARRAITTIVDGDAAKNVARGTFGVRMRPSRRDPIGTRHASKIEHRRRI